MGAGTANQAALIRALVKPQPPPTTQEAVWPAANWLPWQTVKLSESGELSPWSPTRSGS